MKRVSTLAARLKEYRKIHDMTLSECSEKAGIPAQTLNRYELEQRAPKLDIAIELADALGVNPLWLQGFDTDMYGYMPTAEPSSLTTKDAAISSDLADLDAQLNANGHIELVNYAEFLVSQPEYRLASTSRRAVRHYIYPVAAGYASPVEGEDYEMLELDDVPPGADYCITVSGDSMEPYIKDGSIVFVKRNAPLNDFDVGVFYVDGDVLIKQFTQDSMRNVYLLSANPKRADANRMIMHNSNSAFMYYGRVITGKLPQPKYV